MTIYRDELIQRSRFPAYKKEMKNADAQGEVLNDFCGDEVTIFLKLDGARERVADSSFAGEGCALMHASSDLLCERLIGKTLAEVRELTAEDVLASIKETPSPSRLKCLLLPFEALKRVLIGL